MSNNEPYSFTFFEGAITPITVSTLLQSCSSDQSAGAYSVFFGQVRADEIDMKKVTAIDYSANRELSAAIMRQIGTDAFKEHNAHSVHVVHSLGEVKAGELCLMVMVTCGHRKESFAACEYVVERLKKELPVWGKELLSDASYSWKINK